MKLSKPLVHLRLNQCQYYWWDSRIDPREPDYDPDFDPRKPNNDRRVSTPSFFMQSVIISTGRRKGPHNTLSLIKEKSHD